LEWSAIQTVFERAISDVLLLLDCCGAASAAPIAGRAITETIAACGWEAIAPVPGRWSFTGALIEVLDEWIDHSFSVAMLHSQVLSVLKHPQPERRGNKKRKVECRRTPVYIHTSAEPGIPSINLSRLRIKELPDDKPTIGTPVASDKQVSVETENSRSNPDTYTLNNLTSSEPTGNLKVPHVLISLALCEDQELELKACSEWLAAFPALAKYATVKGLYRSHSTLVIASVPVVIWDLLPENRACSFIGYITSDNLLDLKETSKETKTAAYSQIIEADGHKRAGKYATMITPSQTPLIPRLEVPISGPVEIDSSNIMEVEPSRSTNASIPPSSWGYNFPEPILGPLDLPTDEIKSQLGMRSQSHSDRQSNTESFPGGLDKSLPTTCTSCLTQSTPLWHQNLDGQSFCDECGRYLMRHGVPRPLSLNTYDIKERKEQEVRNGLDPERRKSLSDVMLPNFKVQKEATRLRFKNKEVEEWRSRAGDDTDDDETPNQSMFTFNSSSSTRRTTAASENPGSIVPNVFAAAHWIPSEGASIEPVSDSESIRENQIKDDQVYYNPRATEMSIDDQALMQKSRHWIDGPEYPYITATHNQAQTANESAKRWNDAADTTSVLSRTASWGTTRRSEPDIDERVCDNGGSFLKLFSLRIHESERRSAAVSIFNKLGNVIRRKTDKNLKRIRDHDPLVESASRLPVSPPTTTLAFEVSAMTNARSGSNLRHGLQTTTPQAPMNIWTAPETGKIDSSRNDFFGVSSTPPRSSEFSEDFRCSTAPTNYSRNEDQEYDDLNDVFMQDSEQTPKPY
jgi:hypothetical protein